MTIYLLCTFFRQTENFEIASLSKQYNLGEETSQMEGLEITTLSRHYIKETTVSFGTCRLLI